MLLLLVLVSGVFVYWRLTKNDRIRQEACAYLEQVTGGKAEVSNARFSLFGPVELRGVKLFLPGEDQPFFRAGTVLLRHRPWSLFYRGQLDVSEIVCMEPVLNLVHDVDTGWNYETILGLRARQQPPPSGGSSGPLPSLMVRKARLTFAEKFGQLRLRKGQLDLNLLGFACGPDRYKIVLEKEANQAGGKNEESASIEADLATGAVEFSGHLDLGQLNDTLLQQYGRLKDLYQLQGVVEIEGRWDAKGGAGSLAAKLKDASLKLLAEQGNLNLHKVNGTVLIDPNGVRLEGITGKIVQAGEANFAVSGAYHGYDANAPLELAASLTALALPDKLDATGPAADTVDYIHQHYRLEGTADVQASIRRNAAGEIVFDVAASPNDMTIVDFNFPYALHKTRGRIRLTQDGLEIDKIAGTNGKSRVEVNGKTARLDANKTYVYDVTFRDLEFTEELEKAIPKQHRELWKSLAPQGRGSGHAVVAVRNPGQAETLDVDLSLDHNASMEYSGFPYRLDNVAGDIHFSREGLKIGSLSAGSGNTKCTIEGAVLWKGQAADVDLSIQARVPLDAKLAAALTPQGRAILESLHPQGMVDHLSVRLKQAPGGPMEYDVGAHLEGATFKFDGCPYEVTDISGSLAIDPNAIHIKSLAGKHKDTPLTLSGRLVMDANCPALDLQVDAPDVQLDDELLAAMPADVKKVWQQLAPKGRAGVKLSLRRGGPAATTTQPDDYRCEVTARDMQLTYQGFPYTFRGISGTAVATPGRVELSNVTAVDGNMRAVVSGVVTSGDQDRAELSVQATGVPLSSQLLAALPAGRMPAFNRMQAGGTCDLDLSRLVFSVGGAGAVAASQPASAPASPAWRAEGAMTFHDANIDFGLGQRSVTGTLRGLMGSGPGGLEVDANFLIDKLVVNNRVLSEFRGQITKRAASEVLKFDECIGKAYGGRAAGFLEIRLGKDTQYSFRLFVENVSLSELANAGLKDPNAAVPLEGLFDATIEMKLQDGPKPAKQAAGLIHITKGKIVRLPVMLDVLQPMFLSLPGGSPFSEGVASYSLKDDKLTFREIHLYGPALSIVGSGTVDMKTEAIKFSFLGRSGILPRLDNLADELVTGIMRELAEYQVSGTLARPRFRTVPLRSIENIIDKLMRPE